MAADEKRRVYYPDQGRYPGAYVVLPPEWLGEHFMTRDKAVEAAARFNSSSLTRACIALCLAEEWGGIPGLVGADPAAWDFARVPAPLLVWLDVVVVTEFSKVYIIPKAPAEPSSAGLTAAAAATITAGS